MTRFALLPESLQHDPFSVATARAAGVTRRRLRGSDLSAPFTGVRVVTPPTTVEALARAFLPRMRPGLVFAGITGARLWGFPVSTWWEESEPLVIGVPAGTGRTRARGVTTREFDPSRFATLTLDGLPVLSPLGVVAMLMRDLAHDDLVAVLDALLTPSEHYNDLRFELRPHTSPERLHHLALCCRGARGVEALRAAIADARPGVDSPRETRTRLVIGRAGLPEPVLQHEVWVGGELVAVIDLAYPDWMIAIEYEGGHHLTDPAQWAKDILRYELLESLGWIVIRVTKHDLRGDGGVLVERIEKAIARRTPSSAP